MDKKEYDSIFKVLSRVMFEYQKALFNEDVKKPISFALYKVWEYYDKKEPERKPFSKHLYEFE